MKKFDLPQELEKLETKKPPTDDNGGRYFIDEAGYLCRWKQTKDGQIPVKLANFDAEITEEIIEDNGLELSHNYGIEAKLHDRRLPKIEIPASSFNSLNWLHKLGNQTILEPGQTVKDYVRHAIQTRSNGVKRTTYYTHTGWRQIQNSWCYLTAGGAIGAENISVKLPKELQRYNLPLNSENEAEAIRKSLSFLEIGKKEITLPLFAFLYLSPLTTLLEPMPNFAGYIYGETGTFKTTIATLLLSHFGQFNSANNLSNFDDTANALIKRAFTLKDTLLVIDDYHPTNRKTDSQLMESTAQRIVRACANRTGRHRLNPDASEKGAYEPRGMTLITGEEIVSLQSTLARLMVIEISKGDIDKNKLTELQKTSHLLPYAMASYVLWLRNNIQEIQRTFLERFIELRSKAFRESAHRRLHEQTAFLQLGFDIAISWLADKKAITDAEALTLSKEAWDIFTQLSAKQSERLESENPVRQFQEILQALIAQGKVRIEDKNYPDRPLIGGPTGELIGYHDEFYVYLLPVSLWHSVKKFCIAEGTHFPMSKNTLYRMLKTRGLIESHDERHVTLEWIRGKPQRVLKFIGHGICENEVMEVRNDASA